MQNTNYLFRCYFFALAAASIFFPLATPAVGDPIVWQASQPENGPGFINYDDSSALWGSTYDPVMIFGYNQTTGGVPVVAGEPGLSLAIEGNYWVADGNNKMEVYLQYIDGFGGPPLRPLFFSFNRQTQKLDNAFIGGAPIINFGDANNNTINAQITTNALALFGADNTQGTVLNLKSQAGSQQPGVIQLGFNGVDKILSVFPVTETQVYFQIKGTNGIRYYRNPLGGSASGSIAVGGVDDNSAIGIFGSEMASNGVSALVARGKFMMTANIFEVQAQDKTILHAVDKDGIVYMANAAAPASNPVNGVYLYVDQADGKLKYRDAAGVVRIINTIP